MVGLLSALLLATTPSPSAAQEHLAAATFRDANIDLELQSADIHAVLRMFSDIGHVNIIAEPGVTGTVTAKLRDVPWIDAMRAILRTLHLGMIWEGNVIYVMPLD